MRRSCVPSLFWLVLWASIGHSVGLDCNVAPDTHITSQTASQYATCTRLLITGPGAVMVDASEIDAAGVGQALGQVVYAQALQLTGVFAGGVVTLSQLNATGELTLLATSAWSFPALTYVESLTVSATNMPGVPSLAVLRALYVFNAPQSYFNLGGVPTVTGLRTLVIQSARVLAADVLRGTVASLDEISLTSTDFDLSAVRAANPVSLTLVAVTLPPNTLPANLFDLFPNLTRTVNIDIEGMEALHVIIAPPGARVLPATINSLILRGNTLAHVDLTGVTALGTANIALPALGVLRLPNVTTITNLTLQAGALFALELCALRAVGGVVALTDLGNLDCGSVAVLAEHLAWAAGVGGGVIAEVEGCGANVTSSVCLHNDTTGGCDCFAYAGALHGCPYSGELVITTPTAQRYRDCDSFYSADEYPMGTAGVVLDRRQCDERHLALAFAHVGWLDVLTLRGSWANVDGLTNLTRVTKNLVFHNFEVVDERGLANVQDVYGLSVGRLLLVGPVEWAVDPCGPTMDVQPMTRMIPLPGLRRLSAWAACNVQLFDFNALIGIPLDVIFTRIRFFNLANTLNSVWFHHRQVDDLELQRARVDLTYLSELTTTARLRVVWPPVPVLVPGSAPLSFGTLFPHLTLLRWAVLEGWPELTSLAGLETNTVQLYEVQLHSMPRLSFIPALPQTVDILVVVETNVTFSGLPQLFALHTLELGGASFRPPVEVSYPPSSTLVLRNMNLTTLDLDALARPETTPGWVYITDMPLLVNLTSSLPGVGGNEFRLENLPRLRALTVSPGFTNMGTVSLLNLPRLASLAVCPLTVLRLVMQDLDALNCALLNDTLAEHASSSWLSGCDDSETPTSTSCVCSQCVGPPPPPTQPADSNESSVTAIAVGCAVGGCVLVTVLVWVFYVRPRRRHQGTSDHLMWDSEWSDAVKQGRNQPLRELHVSHASDGSGNGSDSASNFEPSPGPQLEFPTVAVVVGDAAAHHSNHTGKSSKDSDPQGSGYDQYYTPFELPGKGGRGAPSSSPKAGSPLTDATSLSPSASPLPPVAAKPGLGLASADVLAMQGQGDVGDSTPASAHNSASHGSYQELNLTPHPSAGVATETKGSGSGDEQDLSLEQGTALVPFPYLSKHKPAPASRHVPSKALRAMTVIDAREVTDFALVGKGSFGSVYRSEWRASEIAVKRPNVISARVVSDFAYEAYIAHRLGTHPHLPVFHGASLTLPNVFLAMQFISHGSLDVYLTHNAHTHTSFSLRNFILVLIDCSAALVPLHHKGVIHRDIAARNFLLKTENGSQRVVICDFGLCYLLPAHKAYGIAPRGDVVPINVTAPEALVYRIFSRETDVFSFGCLMWELWTNRAPFAHLPGRAAAHAIIRGERPALPSGMPLALSALMCAAWDQNPARRPRIDQINRELRQALHTLAP